MKKLLLLLSSVALTVLISAQAPLGMNYQAIVRDASGNPVANGLVGLRLSIRDISANGAVIYQETASVSTNQFGLMTTVIGGHGNLANVGWRNGAKYLQVEVDPTGGTNYTDMGTTQLMSVPYALYAETSGNAGSVGPTGATGPVGPAGANGVNGTNGTDGAKGATGATGPAGATGAQGATGPKGDTGADGAQNAWGFNGNAGTSSANFIGTTDNVAVNFRMNNQASGKLDVNNTFFGYKTGLVNAGIQNTGVGAEVLKANTSGFANTAVGFQDMINNTTGNYNNAMGYNALVSNTTGSSNTANGAGALYYNTTGSYNTAVGYDALLTNTTGLGNTATGTGTLFDNTTGNYNTGYGYEALKENTTGGYNTATGTAAMFNNSVGASNSAHGYNSMLNNTSGSNNTAAGYQSLGGNTTGSYNVALGNGALANNTTGSSNTAVGNGAGTTLGVFSNTTALGNGAATSASNQIRLGNSAVTSIGGFQDWTNVSDGRFKKDITESVPGLTFITQLRPVTYHLDMQSIASYLHTNDNARIKEAEELKESVLQTGFIAQEVEKSAKELGFDFSGVDAPKNETDFYGLRYAEFTVPLVKAVQELNAKNEQQQQLINTLLQRIEVLEKTK